MVEDLNIPDEDELERWVSQVSVNANTKQTYKRNFRQFLNYVSGGNLNFNKLGENDIRAYMTHLIASGLSAKTVNAYLAAVKSYFSWAKSDVAENIHVLPAAKVPKREFLETDEVYELLWSIPRKTEEQMRNYCIVNLMVRTGLREKEVAGALIGDLNVHGEEGTLWICGKGHTDKDDYVVLAKSALAPIQEYLETYRHKESKDSPLFSSCGNRNAGGALTPGSVSRIVKTALRRIGFDNERYTAHSLRHTAITLALQGGATEKQVQTMARHKDPATTAIYVHDFERRRRPAEMAIEELLGD